eukprot:2303911-Amphidinium_carterae.1
MWKPWDQRSTKKIPKHVLEILTAKIVLLQPYYSAIDAQRTMGDWDPFALDGPDEGELASAAGVVAPPASNGVK